MSKQPTLEDIAGWPTPNYVDPETRRPLVLGVEIPLMILVGVFTMIRFYSRIFIIRGLGWDDWFMLAATITALANSTMTIISTDPAYQTGYHLWDVRPTLLLNPVKTFQIAMAAQLLYVPLTLFTKISVLITYLHIFPSMTNKWFCWGNMALTVVWAVLTFFVALFQCSPVESYWLQAKYPNRKCIDVGILFYSSGAVNILSDLLIYLWPAKDLYHIHISLKQRVTLISMFCLGVIICIAGVVRIWYCHIFLNSYDLLWHGATLYVIIAIETSIGIVCGCLPACKPLMSTLFPNVFGSTTAGGSSNNPSHKKSSKPGSKNFPFQSLGDSGNGGGGIVKGEDYSVTYSSQTSAKSGYGADMGVPHIKVERASDKDVYGGGDVLRAESQEWIMMQDGARRVDGRGAV